MTGVDFIVVAEVVIQAHAVLRAPSTNAGDKNSQGMTFQSLLCFQLLNGSCCFWGQGDLMLVCHKVPVVWVMVSDWGGAMPPHTQDAYVEGARCPPPTQDAYVVGARCPRILKTLIK